jgi:hypothetical protein
MAPKSARESLTDLVMGALLEDGKFTGVITTKSGARRRYEDGKEVPLDGGKGGAGGASVNRDDKDTTSVPADAPNESHVWGDVHDALPDDAKGDAGVVAKLRRMTAIAYHTVWNVLASQGIELAGDILDTADDYSKISYSKYSAQGTAQHDPFYVHLGVPYSAVAVVVSKVVAAAHGYVTGKLSAKEAIASLTDEERRQVAEAAAELLAGIFKAWGLEGKVPVSAEDVAKRMGERSAG